VSARSNLKVKLSPDQHFTKLSVSYKTPQPLFYSKYRSKNCACSSCGIL